MQKNHGSQKKETNHPEHRLNFSHEPHRFLVTTSTPRLTY